MLHGIQWTSVTRLGLVSCVPVGISELDSWAAEEILNSNPHFPERSILALWMPIVSYNTWEDLAQPIIHPQLLAATRSLR